MAKIIQNTTGSDIFIDFLGLNLPASGSLTIDARDYTLLASSDALSEVQALINSGDVTINNGTSTLSTEDALDFIRYPDRADSIFFDDSASTSVEGDDVQEALESIDELVSPLVVPITLAYNGSLSNNEFIGYTNLIPGDDTPIISPITGLFTGFTWSNRNSNADFALEFRKNTTGGAAFFTWSVDNTQTASVDLVTPEAFTAGDEIYVKYIDEGQNGTDAVIVLRFKA